MPTFHAYSTSILFDERLVGGIPALSGDDDERLMQLSAWLRTQSGQEAPEGLKGDLTNDPDMPEAEETPLNAFKRDEKGLYIEGRQVKAMMREAAQRLGLLASKRGTRQVIQHDVHVRDPNDRDSQKLYLQRTDAHGQVSPIMVPDGVDERPISVVTRQGPRTALKRSEFLIRPHVFFDIYILHDGIGKGIVGDKELAEILDLAQWIGLGADRSQGAGTFRVTSVVGPREEQVGNVYDLVRPYEAPSFTKVERPTTTTTP